MWETPGVETRPNVIVEMTVNKSLPRLLLYYWEELFISEEREAFIMPSSASPSKFSFLWCALFLVRSHKQRQGCRHWISRLCHRVAPGSGPLSCAATAYISMWKAKAVPNIPSKHLSCPKKKKTPVWKNSRDESWVRAECELLLTFSLDEARNRIIYKKNPLTEEKCYIFRVHLSLGHIVCVHYISCFVILKPV